MGNRNKKGGEGGEGEGGRGEERDRKNKVKEGKEISIMLVEWYDTFNGHKRPQRPCLSPLSPLTQLSIVNCCLSKSVHSLMALLWVNRSVPSAGARTMKPCSQCRTNVPPFGNSTCTALPVYDKETLR